MFRDLLKTGIAGVPRSLVPLFAAAMSFGGLEAHASESGAEILEEVIVQATRSGRRLQDGALRIEVRAGEEIAEKLLKRTSQRCSLSRRGSEHHSRER